MNENEILVEGINFIQEKYPNYDRDKFIDDVENIKYSVQMLEKLNINISDIFFMIIFDTLIGNSDRHHSNWGYITCLDNYKSFCPLYDNGSSLCSYVNEVDIKTILKDRNRYNALVDTKSKSCIGWDDIRPIRHFELLYKIRKNYYNETIAFVNRINEKITEEAIKNILSKFSDEIISSEKKELLLKFIIDRKIKIVKIFDLEVINNE